MLDGGTPPRHILIFEPDARGHAEEWLLHIAHLLEDGKAARKVTMVVARALARRLTHEAERLAPGTLEVVALTDRESRLCINGNLTVNAFARWWIVRRYLRRTGADEAFFLCIDTLSLPFALGLGMDGKPASGVLFRPSVHYAAMNKTDPSLTEKVRDLRKELLYPQMLRNPAVSTIHSLDPYFPGYARERYIHGAKVAALADPVSEAFETSAGQAELKPRGPAGRTRFLLFGELTERKGIIQTLQACAKLSPEVAKRATVVLAGRVDPALKKPVQDLLWKARMERPELWIELDDRRLSLDELAEAILSTDMILAPYQRFVGSSGVLIWAARAGRPVITQAYGLLGRQTHDHKLGLAVDTTNPDVLADAIAIAVEKGPRTLFDEHGARRFAARREGLNFAARVLGLQQWDALTNPRESVTNMILQTTS